MPNYNGTQGEGSIDRTLRVTSESLRTEEENQNNYSWLPQWNQDAQMQPIQAGAISYEPLATTPTSSIPEVPPRAREISYPYPANTWQYPSMQHPQPTFYGTGVHPPWREGSLHAGLHPNIGGNQISQYFEEDHGSVGFSTHDEGTSFLEQISAEQQEFIMSLGRSSAFTPVSSTRPTHENQIRPDAEAGIISPNTSIFLSSDSTSVAQETSAPAFVTGSSTRVIGSYTRAVREAMYNSPAHHSACAGVVDVMAQFKLPLEVGDTHPNVPGSTRLQVDVMLNAFINGWTDDIKQWLNSGRKEDVTSDDIMKAAVLRRSTVARVYMHYCYWCDIWLTTKGNLANHIRSHLGFHISFCENCNFSAVTPTLPSRHKSRCRGRNRGGS